MELKSELITALLIDDSQIAQRLLAKILTDRGLKVVGEASNGREGLELYTKWSINARRLKGRRMGGWKGWKDGGKAIFRPSNLPPFQSSNLPLTTLPLTHLPPPIPLRI